jgi:hypothetical protein
MTIASYKAYCLWLLGGWQLMAHPWTSGSGSWLLDHADKALALEAQMRGTKPKLISDFPLAQQIEGVHDAARKRLTMHSEQPNAQQEPPWGVPASMSGTAARNGTAARVAGWRVTRQRTLL